jgi:putative transcriptional regulator
MAGHHPCSDTLEEYARGALHAGAALVVACHLETCAPCMREVSLWETLGGALLQQLSPSPLADDAESVALARLSDVTGASAPSPQGPAFLARFEIPGPLRRQKFGNRRWLAPHIWFAPILIGREAGTRTYLVYADKNTTLPRHTHAGSEFTQILCGSYRDSFGTFEAGDFADMGESDCHAPAVTAGMECLCLISADGPMRLTGLSARLIQNLAGNLY